MTPSGWAQIPDVSNIRVDILSSLKQYTNIPQIAYQVWRATEGKEYERVSLLEAGVRGLTTGFTETVTSIPIASMFTGPLLRFGAMPEPPTGGVPQVAKATTVPTAIEVAPFEEKQKAMNVLQPPPQLAVYKTMETAGQIAGAIFQQWLPQQAFKTWKSIDVQDVLQRYQAGEKITALERLKLEAWIHTPEKIWNALAEATSSKVKYEIPKEVEARWARGLGEEGWGGEAWKSEVLSWQEVPKGVAEKLQSISSKVGWLPVKTAKGEIEYIPSAQEGVHYAAAQGPSWRWLWKPESEWIQYTPRLPRSGVEMRAWRGLGDYSMFAQYALSDVVWKGALPKPIDLGASVEGVVRGVVDIDKILEQAELWKPKLEWIEAHPAVEALQLGGRPMEPLTVVSPLAEVKVPAAPPVETMKPIGLTLSSPIFSVPVRVTETPFSLSPFVFPSIPVTPLEKEKERKEEHPLGPLFPVVVKVPVLEEERIEPEFRIGVPKPRIEFEEHKRESEHFQPLTLPSRFEKMEKRLEERSEQLTFAGAMPSVVEEQARRQARALAPIQLLETPQQPSPPPSSPSPTGGGEKGRLPGLPHFSPPPASVVYRTPVWRLGKYWRVDWFAQGLKLDFSLGRISRLLAAQAAKAPKAKLPEPKLPKLAEKAGERERAKRQKVKQVDWFKDGLLGEPKRPKSKKRKRRRVRAE
jgi:hypothetical protein